jgi:hypothetical protein
VKTILSAELVIVTVLVLTSIVVADQAPVYKDCEWGGYTGGWIGGSEQKRYGSESRPPAIAQSEGILGEKAARTPAQQKISSRLLYAVKVHLGDVSDTEGLMRRSSVKVDADGTTLVDIKSEVTEAVLAKVDALGGKVISSFPQYQAIRARMPLGQIEALAEMRQVIFIRPAAQAITR